MSTGKTYPIFNLKSIFVLISGIKIVDYCSEILFFFSDLFIKGADHKHLNKEYDLSHCMRKATKPLMSYAVIAHLTSAFVFAAQIVQSFLFLKSERLSFYLASVTVQTSFVSDLFGTQAVGFLTQRLI